DKSIDYFQVKRVDNNISKKLKKIPLLRGIVSLVQASANGIKHLEFASDRYDVDPVDDEKMEKEKETSKLAMVIGIGAIGVLSFLVSKLIFTLTPAIVANLFSDWISSNTGQVLLEGLFKLILLLSYIYFISLTPLIKRVFQYHGAEHKVINAYENKLPLTIENVQSQSRLHYRC